MVLEISIHFLTVGLYLGPLVDTNIDYHTTHKNYQNLLYMVVKSKVSLIKSNPARSVKSVGKKIGLAVNVCHYIYGIRDSNTVFLTVYLGPEI